MLGMGASSSIYCKRRVWLLSSQKLYSTFLKMTLLKLHCKQTELNKLCNLRKCYIFSNKTKEWGIVGKTECRVWSCSLQPASLSINQTVWLQKGAGFHLDFFCVSLLMVLTSVMGLPWYVSATVISLAHMDSLKKESTTCAPGEQPKFLGIRYCSYTFHSAAKMGFCKPCCLLHFPFVQLDNCWACKRRGARIQPPFCWWPACQRSSRVGKAAADIQENMKV